MNAEMMARMYATQEKRKLLDQLIHKEVRNLERHIKALTEIQGSLKDSNAYRDASESLQSIKGYLAEL